MKSLAWAVFFSLHTATLAFVPRGDSSCGTCTTEKPSILCQFSSLFKPSCKPSLLKYTNQESEWEESEWYSPPPPAAATGTEQSVSEEQPTRLPRGVTTKVTVIRSKVDLEKFLEEDDRLCVVRFHAAWYVFPKFRMKFSQFIVVVGVLTFFLLFFSFIVFSQ